jgi:hypothetical protein
MEKKMNTETERWLRREFPEGIPSWMLNRGYTEIEVRALMKIRRQAFPETVRKTRP